MTEAFSLAQGGCAQLLTVSPFIANEHGNPSMLAPPWQRRKLSTRTDQLHWGEIAQA